MPEYVIPPTAYQREYVAGLQRKLHLTDAALDQHCRETFGAPYRELDRGQVTRLLNQMEQWKRVPANLQRVMGQLDLFEAPT